MTIVINKHGEREVQITVRIPEKLYDKVKDEAKEKNSSVTAIAKRAIEKYFQGE